MSTKVERWVRDAGPDGRGDFVEFEVRFTKREWGGWVVRRADNGRELGWMYRSTDEKTWTSYVSDEAFRGSGKDDKGDILDRVPAYLSRRLGESFRHDPVAVGCTTRVCAAAEILDWLDREHAPAMGYGPHYMVAPWESRIR